MLKAALNRVSDVVPEVVKAGWKPVGELCLNGKKNWQISVWSKIENGAQRISSVH